MSKPVADGPLYLSDGGVIVSIDKLLLLVQLLVVLSQRVFILLLRIPVILKPVRLLNIFIRNTSVVCCEYVPVHRLLVPLVLLPVPSNVVVHFFYLPFVNSLLIKVFLALVSVHVVEVLAKAFAISKTNAYFLNAAIVFAVHAELFSPPVVSVYVLCPVVSIFYELLSELPSTDVAGVVWQNHRQLHPFHESLHHLKVLI